MNIFAAIYDFIQAAREALLDVLAPLVMPDWGWLVTVILPLTFGAFVLLYFLYLYVRLRRNAWANVDRRPRRLGGRLTPPPGVHASASSWWPVALSIGFFLALLGLVTSALLLGLGVVVTLVGGWGWLRSANREWRRAELSADRGAGAHAVPAGGAGAQALASHATGGVSGALVPPNRALVPHGSTAVTPVSPAYEHAIEPPPGVHMPAPSWWPVYASAAAFCALLGLVVSLALLVGGMVLALLAFVGWYVDSYRELKVAEGLAPRPHVRNPLAVFPRILASVGVLTIVVSITFAVGPGVVAQLFPAQGAGPGGPAACAPTDPIEITAKNTTFSKKELCLPGDTFFEIVFHNEDAGIPHNIAILETGFNGEVFNGVATMTYDMPPITPGTYRFICVVHPTSMFGTATVVAGGPGGSPAGGSPPGGPQPSPAASGSP